MQIYEHKFFINKMNNENHINVHAKKFFNKMKHEIREMTQWLEHLLHLERSQASFPAQILGSITIFQGYEMPSFVFCEHQLAHMVQTHYTHTNK